MCFCVCVVDYDAGSVEKSLEAEESEDTDCDGSSLPEDSPEVLHTESILLSEIKFFIVSMYNHIM